MTGRVVAPLVFPVGSGPARTRGVSVAASRRVPVVRLLPVRERRSWLYAMAVVDDRGRVAARSVLEALGWGPFTRVSAQERSGLILVRADAAGASLVTRQGHLRVPVTERHRCGAVADRRVLLAADPDAGRLVLHPLDALDAVIGRRHAEVFGECPA